ncbi:MAG: lysylphosphatidylglycerol synthase domain-containing protein, partial [Actinomycetota bacterium]
VWQRRDDLRPLWDDPSWNLGLIAVLIVVGHFLNSSEFWVVYRATGVKVGFFENWMVFTAGLLGNLLPGQVGTVYKFRYMHGVHNVSYAKNGSNYGANLVISLGSSAIVGIIGVVAYAAGGGDFAWIVFVVFVALGLTCTALLRFRLPDWSVLRGKPARFAASFNNGWREIQSTPCTSIQVVIIDIVKYALTAWRFQLAFGLLGVHESFWFFLVVAPAAAIAGIIAFTPGALGFRELFVTTAAVGMGSSFDDGLLAATTDRGVMLASALVLGVAGYAYTVPRLRRARTTQPTPN